MSRNGRQINEMNRQQLNAHGNTYILNLHKVAFLCSRKCPAAGKYLTFL
jgi:hypothetical protein